GRGEACRSVRDPRRARGRPGRKPFLARAGRKAVTPIEKVLIANRGEIAVRVIRACRELGIQSVAVYSEADAHSLPVHLADEAIGYPVMLKAKAGGGGRGMRKAISPSELQRLWAQAASEARASFGDDGIYVERCLEGVRHVEAQIAVDESGRGICLGERECSIQRRNQKMIEEAPSASISESL